MKFFVDLLGFVEMMIVEMEGVSEVFYFVNV